MEKVFAFMLMPLLLIGLVSVSLADEVTLKAAGENQWTVLDSGGQELGTLAKVDEAGGGYSILPKGGQYLGIIRSNGDLQLTGRHPVISPSQAQLYLDALEAVKTLK